MRRVALGVTLAVLLAACGTGGGSTPLCEEVGSSAADVPLTGELEAALDPVISRDMQAMDAVGLSLGVQCGESPVYVKGYGMADLALQERATAETVYEAGSITKQFTAAVVVQLSQTGQLDLDDPIGAYVPSLPEDWQPITIRHLLTHTGGLPDHFAIFNLDPTTPFDWEKAHTAPELLDAFLELDDELVAPPGSEFRYSNTAYVVLAALLENLTGRPLTDALHGKLFGPLALEHTAMCSPALENLAVGYNVGPEGPIPGPVLPASFLSGAAGVCSTVGDLIRWERSLVGGEVVGADGFRLMTTAAELDDGSSAPYGLGLVLDTLGSSDAIFHEGGTAAFSSWLAYYPTEDLTIAVLSNTFGPNSAAIQDLVIDVTEVARG